MIIPTGITCAVFAKSNEITSPIGAHLPHPTGKSFRFLCLGASFRLLFRKCVLLCLQVLPAPPFRKIKRNHIADRGTSPVPDGQIFSSSLLRRVLPPAFPQMRLAAAFGYYLRRGRLLFLGHNFSRGAPPSSLKRFYRRAKNYFHHYILIGRQMSSKLPSNLRELYANFERKNRLACAFA